jgi:hypothetical protein
VRKIIRKRSDGKQKQLEKNHGKNVHDTAVTSGKSGKTAETLVGRKESCVLLKLRGDHFLTYSNSLEARVGFKKTQKLPKIYTSVLFFRGEKQNKL